MMGIAWGRVIGRFRFVSLLAALLAALSACAVAPGTGRTIFTGGLSESGEKELGFQEHPKILESFGGAYNDPELARYVQSVGDLLVATSETPERNYTFTVLNTPTVNAFALPGGYVYVTRGLVTLANSEAELAGVMGHEIGHVTARHSAERYGNVVLGNVATIASAIFLGSAGAQATGTAAALAVQSYSRDQEFEADELGIRYVSRGGYDPYALSDFLDSLLAHSRLQAEQMGRPGAADQFDIMQTHPLTSDRVSRAAVLAGQTGAGGRPREREYLLAQLDGVVYGDTADQGYIRGRDFYHPDLGFKFRAPDGFFLMNNPDAVVGYGPNEWQMRFDAAPKSYGGSMASYIRDVWAEGVPLDYLREGRINGYPAAMAAAGINTRSGPAQLTIAAFRFDSQRIFRFLFIASPGNAGALQAGAQRAIDSFAPLTQGEAGSLRPYRIRLHQVRQGDTPAGLAAGFPFSEWALETFYVLNGMRPGEALRIGETVKLVGY